MNLPALPRQLRVLYASVALVASTLILPLSNHMGRDHTGQSVHQALYLSRAEAWKKAALAGQSLPPK
jgi:hypothetical protein